MAETYQKQVLSSLFLISLIMTLLSLFHENEDVSPKKDKKKKNQMKKIKRPCPVVQMVDGTIHWINKYPLNKSLKFDSTIISTGLRFILSG